MFFPAFRSALPADAEDDVSFWGLGFLMLKTDAQPGHLNLTTSEVILSGSNLSFALHFGQTTFIFVDIVHSIFMLLDANWLAQQIKLYLCSIQ
jgi:hypothetical protein